jgi:hypothetical protein
MAPEFVPILLTVGVVVLILIGLALTRRGRDRGGDQPGPYSSSTEMRAGFTALGVSQIPMQPEPPNRPAETEEGDADEARRDRD